MLLLFSSHLLPLSKTILGEWHHQNGRTIVFYCLPQKEYRFSQSLTDKNAFEEVWESSTEVLAHY